MTGSRLVKFLRNTYQRVAARTMEIPWGPQGAAFVYGLILCSIFGASNGSILGGARACFAMARDGVLFPAVGKVHQRFHTSYIALLIQGIWSIVLAASGTYEQLYTYVIFTGWIFYALALLSVIVMRCKRPELPRPCRVLADPVLPVAFAAAALMIIVNSLITQPKECGIGLGIVLVGIPVYIYWTRASRLTQNL